MELLNSWRYRWRFYSKLRRANRAYDPVDDMAALPFPQVIQLQTINACQAACTMCPYPVFDGKFAKGRMQDDLFERIVDEIAAHDEVDTFVPMLQNEPLLDAKIFDRVARFKERTGGRVAVELVTNGAYLTEKNVARMRDSGLDLLDISLDALSRDVYERVRKGLDYDAVMEGVERVLEADLPDTTVFVRILRLSENKDEVGAFARHWRRRGVPVFVYSANSRGDTVDESEGPVLLRESQLGLVDKLRRRAVRGWMGHCPSPFSAAYILNNGDMLMCTHDWARREILGNVRESSIAELWNGDRMREIRRLVSERRYSESPACRDCSLWREGWV